MIAKKDLTDLKNQWPEKRARHGETIAHAVWEITERTVGVWAFVSSCRSRFPLWQSFSHPSDTLLPNQPLTASMQLTSSSPAHGGYYTIQMLQQPTSLSLGLIYNLPDSYITSLQSYTNYSY
ncbi:G-type lectin S-receptor-like serine/threonine-protein kinase [Vitis vinifera]|uniref:G-type lectin S-receptor-like serine/threonine-protein kinase n=1 Tax=Vitis vinifera TaxID=29760 RepID=A0A438ID15_VITVI|nr:G-type lectin S-receptor-like serine/threonine-protein kinase [Vitis vinifera]